MVVVARKPTTAAAAATVNTTAAPTRLQIWLTAARPHTLTASFSPCLVAWAMTRPAWHLQLAWTVFCFTVQLGTNLHNDYSDYVQGADTHQRVGPARATARGWLTPTATCRAATLMLGGTAASGVYLVQATQQGRNPVAWLLVLSSIFNAFAYTAGPYPLGYIGLEHASIAYAGLGDLFVLLYFGYVAVLMLPYLLSCQQQQSGTAVVLSRPIHWPQQWRIATSVGLLATNIIVVNNLRDRHTDVLVNKRTTAVRFGRTFAIMEYCICLVVSYALVVYERYMGASSTWQLLPLLSLPLALREARQVAELEGPDLNSHVGGAAKVQFIFCILVALSLVLS